MISINAFQLKHWEIDTRIILSSLTVIVVVVYSFMSFFVIGKRQEHKHYHHRTTSHASAIAVDRQLLEKGVFMKQNVINSILFFRQDNNAPTSARDMRNDFVMMMAILANKYDRMKSIPRFNDKRKCIWHPIYNLERSIDNAVSIDADFLSRKANNDNVSDSRILQRAHVHIGQILLSHDDNGNSMPLWRVVLLSPNAVLIRIDHCICDGLSAATLLRDIGTKEGNAREVRLQLGDISPILKKIHELGDYRILSLPLKLLWMPYLWRAVSFLKANLNLPRDVPNPLRPLPGSTMPIPNASVGTVYLPSIEIELFKDISK